MRRVLARVLHARQAMMLVPGAHIIKDDDAEQRQQAGIPDDAALAIGRHQQRRGERAQRRPVLPPTWNTDCARPWRPPDAMRATRLDSGWNTDDPMPTAWRRSGSRG